MAVAMARVRAMVLSSLGSWRWRSSIACYRKG
jgi:hypothetical protein